MASSVSAELLKQLSVASEGLNNVSTIFNEQIKIIEEALGSYNLGVSAWALSTTINETAIADNGSVFELTRQVSVGYDKRGGKWRLMVHSFVVETEDRQEWVLLDAPREMRLQAIKGIPKLLEKLIEEAATLTAEMTQKTTEARMLAVSIKPKKGQ
jgi:hypothetical protein